ncbi:MAG: four helix bundle protein [Clostridiales bacterium]|nr:four helix bundle protein [Clostridiales bacterium]
MIKENKLVDLSIEFSLNIINSLKNIKGHSSLVNQLERSATSIGANIHEANYAQSKPDFISKLQIALKECYESEYWLILFEKTNLISETSIKNLKNMCGTIRRLLISSITTAKNPN